MSVIWRSASLVLAAAVMAVGFGTGCARKEAAPPEVRGNVAAPPAADSKPSAARKPAAAAKGDDVWSKLSASRTALKSYTMVVNSGGQSARYSMKMDDGAPVAMRSDMGDGSWTLIQFDRKVQYVYSPQAGGAMKMTMKDIPNMRGEMDKELERYRAKGVKVTDATLDGLSCWKLSSDDGTVWVDKRYGLPRQTVNQDKTVKMAYEDINSVPDRTFELPKGTKVRNMDDMMKQMPAPKGIAPKSGN